MLSFLPLAHMFERVVEVHSLTNCFLLPVCVFPCRSVPCATLMCVCITVCQCDLVCVPVCVCVYTRVLGSLSNVSQRHPYFLPAPGSYVWESSTGIVYSLRSHSHPVVFLQTPCVNKCHYIWCSYGDMLTFLFWQGVMIVHGAKIGYFQGDIRWLSDDLNTLRPTVFPVVPRLLNRMHDKVGGYNDDGLIDRSISYQNDHMTQLILAF